MPPRRSTSLAFALAALLCAAAPASAITVNPSFETGDLTGWTTVGHTVVRNNVLGIAPTDAAFQILLTTRGAAVDVPTTETAMGLVAGTLQGIFDTFLGNPGISIGSGPTEGSAFQQSFFADAGDTVFFDYDFLTRENPPETLYTDFMWGHLLLPDASTVSGVLAHAALPASSFFGTSNPNWLQTGYSTFSFMVAQTGTYTLTLGVHDVQDATIHSAGLFDNFQLVKSPEPDTFLLLAFGLTGLAWASRRQQPVQRPRQR